MAPDFACRSHCFKALPIHPRSRRLRLWCLFGGALAWSVLLCTRLVSLQITDFERWQEWGLKQHFAQVKLASERGPILDRNDRLMAVSIPAGSVYVRPRQVRDKNDTAKALAQILSVSEDSLHQKFKEEKPFVWIKRQITRNQADKIRALKLPGIDYILESKRVYPYAASASAALGKVGIDGVGLAGLESLHEKFLRGDEKATLTRRDALGNLIEPAADSAGALQLPKGQPLQLTLDAGIQVILSEELQEGRKNANAKAALGLMIDAESGEILAMGQSPSVDPNQDSVNPQELRNLVVEATFEPGSIMKPLVAAAALDARVVSSSELINCGKGSFYYGRHVIRDVHPYNLLSFHDVLVRSSNIGMTQVGDRLGKNQLYAALRRFGFGESSLLGLPGETKGILRSPEQWAKVDVATHSFGQGIAVTPLQVVRAVSAIANGGKLPRLSLVANGQSLESHRVITERTAAQVKRMMYAVVEDEHGTGQKAGLEGLRVGGKTGTAQKSRTDGPGYKDGAYVASFVGFVDGAPLGLNRVLTLLVLVDEPDTDTIYGGTLAAPVFQRIMQRSLSYFSARGSEAIRSKDGNSNFQRVGQVRTLS